VHGPTINKYDIVSNKVQHVEGSNWQTAQSQTVWWYTYKSPIPMQSVHSASTSQAAKGYF